MDDCDFWVGGHRLAFLQLFGCDELDMSRSGLYCGLNTRPSRGRCRVTTRVFWADLNPYFGRGDHGTGFRIAVPAAVTLSSTPGLAPSHSVDIRKVALNQQVVSRWCPAEAHTVRGINLLPHVNSSPGPDPRSSWSLSLAALAGSRSLT